VSSSIDERRFPWGYLALVASSPLLPAVAFLVVSGRSGPDAMSAAGWLMLAVYGAVFLAVAGAVVGFMRLLDGEGRSVPALRWLVWIPVVLCLLYLFAS
jgi:hypothetical protein